MAPTSPTFLLSDEQQLIWRTAHDYVQERMPVSHFRALRDRRDPLGYDPERWAEMAELGFPGLIVPEAYGGAGLGFRELGLVLEECGRTLAPTPLLSTGVLAASALWLGAGEARRSTYLPELAAGRRIVAFAHDEGTRHARTRIQTRAERRPGPFDDVWVLSGEKAVIADGHVAQAIIVSARVGGNESDRDGIALFLVPARTPGVTIERVHTIDGRNAARARFDNASVDATHALGVPGECADLLEALLDRGAIALAAEMLGGIREAFDRTVAYLKERKQFGVPIGSFQALKHRAARLFCEIELTRSVVAAALDAVDRNAEDLPLLASAAKARASDTYLAVTNEAVQMHGGVGVTDEYDIGLFLKRARTTSMSFGDASFHRDRYARLRGY